LLCAVGLTLFIPSPCEGLFVRHDFASTEADRQPLAKARDKECLSY